MMQAIASRKKQRGIVGLSRSGSTGKNWSTFLLALIASIGILLLRLQASLTKGSLYLEFGSVVAIALGVHYWLSFRMRLLTDCEPLKGRVKFYLRAMGAIAICSPMIRNAILTRFVGSSGEATELVWLAMLQYAAIWQASIATTRRQEWIAFLLSSFLMLFGIATSDRQGMFMVVLPFGLVAAWWLMSQYWQSIERGFVAVNSEPLVRLRLTLVGILCVVTGILGCIAASQSKTISLLDGFMPTSGGRDQMDPASRQGVGDGDMLVAAHDEAFTFGPVESDLFLDSQTPSLYDMVSEVFGEPKKKRTVAFRAIALQGQVQDAHGEATESKQKGAEFAAIRQPVDRSKPIKPKGSKSYAVMYLIGSAPQHLRLETFDGFDGVQWTQSQSLDSTKHQSPPKLRQLYDKPWMQITPCASDLACPVRERITIKVINFNSQRVPSPSLLTDVHVDRIDQEDFFGWTNDGQLMMPNRDQIPQFTVLHQLHQIPILHPLRNAKDVRSKISHNMAAHRPADLSPALAGNWLSHYLQMPRVRSSFTEFANQLILEEAKESPDKLTDWQKVETLVAAMRRQFKVDSEIVPSEMCEDVVQHVMNARRGPDYLLATTACMLIRSIGLPSRLVSGFYASAHRYDIKSGQTEVLKEDMHMWAEVFVHGVWLPIEPCSGYAIPREHRSWYQWAVETAWYLQDSAVRNPLTVAMVAVSFGLVFYFRRRLVDAFCSVAFMVTIVFSALARVRCSLKLLRWRMWFWNVRKPQHATVQLWLDERLRKVSNLSDSDRKLYIHAVQRISYAPNESMKRWMESHSKELCKASWAITRNGLSELFRIGKSAQWTTERT